MHRGNTTMKTRMLQEEGKKDTMEGRERVA